MASKRTTPWAGKAMVILRAERFGWMRAVRRAFQQGIAACGADRNISIKLLVAAEDSPTP
jgi:hypothetical protein